MDYFKESLLLHKRLKGKIQVTAKMPVRTTDDLSLAYSPGVAEPSRAIAQDPDKVWDYTLKGNAVAIVSDGSAVLGLGNIGAAAAIPVMEGKALLFKRFANIDAFPICLDTQNVDEIVNTVRYLAPVFGGINLEDISAPRSFEIEQRLQDLGIPVFHDDQHGTAIVVLAALLNAARVVGKPLQEMKVVINGAGAAGIAIARLLRCVDNEDPRECIAVQDAVIADRKGIIHARRTDLNPAKREVLQYTNPDGKTGSLQDALREADVFIGVSAGNLLTSEDVRSMARDAIILALAVSLKEVADAVGTAPYVVDLVGGIITPAALPAILMALCMFVAFSTGTSWGTYAVVFPVAMPLAWAVQPDPFFVTLCFAAVIGGSVFGDQCSPISDTTILSSLATGCDLLDHVHTQIPLALTAAGLGAIAYTILVMVLV